MSVKIGREALRREAKKIYKEQTKNIPRRNRIPFSEFFKRYKKMKVAEQLQKQQPVDTQEPDTEDFNFEDLINVNEISDDDLVVEEE